MARLIRCPKCQEQVDVTNESDGATVRCSGCASMLRVPGKAAAEAAPAPNRPRKTTTPIMRKMERARTPGGVEGTRPGRRSRGVDPGARYAARRKGMHPGALIGIILGSVLLVVLVVMLAVNHNPGDKQQTASSNNNTKSTSTATQDSTPLQNSQPASETPTKKPDLPKKPKSGLRKGADGKYTPPDTFEPGAGKLVEGMRSKTIQELGIDAAMLDDVKEKLAAGRIPELLKDDHTVIGAAVSYLASDDPPLARNSLQFLHDYCNKRGLMNKESGNNPVDVGLVNSAQYRANSYDYWSTWYLENRHKMRPSTKEGTPIYAMNPKTADWVKLIMKCRQGGSFEEEGHPGHESYMMIKSAGKEAYPYLIEHIDDTDPGIGRAVLSILLKLTGRESAKLYEHNKAGLKTEWKNWLADQK